MASSKWNQNNNNFNFRPRSGKNDNTLSFGQNRGKKQSYDRHTNNNNYYQSQEQILTNSHNIEQFTSDSPSEFRTRANDDEINAYAVNLQLKPVEMGIIAKTNQRNQEFKGLGVFNRYFGLLAPTNNFGYTLPDVWDGYFHITLAKFLTRVAPHQLEEVFSRFIPSLEDLPYIPDIIFRASSIKIIPGENRPKGREHINFIVLPIDYHSETIASLEKLQSLLEKIEKQTESNDWNATPFVDLHVTIRKYSNIGFILNKIRIEKFPIEFRCSHLEVKQTRERAVNRYKKGKDNIYRWWIGVTEIDKKCSGCHIPIISDRWEGFCLACGQYESIIPIWSTNGKNIYHYHQIQNQENMRNANTLSELNQHTNYKEL
ncbi:unnamed protein product [Rotaria sordida]|uniref:Uncharacterized protein n=1 Tax=Rotaria sordida TaxID=392033 RepID=A0A819LTV1_9BILA|nr:unnamed protein product [Rotaria sordida]CAF3971570.1 unnamed protein product [Rotaria sordida]